VKPASKPGGKQTIGTINRVQGAYYQEFGTFSQSIAELGIGIRPETKNYHYRILSPMMPIQTLDESEDIPTSFERGTIAIAQAKNPGLKQYVGAVFVSQEAGTAKEVEIIGKVCVVNAGAPLPSTLPILINGEIQCPEGTEPLG
jgi:hypothetical protein